MAHSANRQYLPEIDQLRAFAALLVLFYHGLQLLGARLVHGAGFDPSQHWLYPANPLLAIIEEGHSGVGLFIVLSGFILSLGAIGNSIDYKSFLIARIFRIYPMLTVCLLAAIHATPTNLSSLLTSFFPLNIAGAKANNFAAMFWAVAVEFQCYLVFPLLIAISNRHGSRHLVQIVAVALVLRLLAIFADGANPRDLSYWTVIGRIDQFCIGMIAARLYVGRNLTAMSAWWFLPASALAALVLWKFNRLGGWPLVSAWKTVWPTIEGTVWAGFIVTYIAAGRLLPSRLGRLGAKLGEISYSLYLVHFVVLAAIITAKLYVTPTGNGYYDALATTFLVALPLAVLIATLTYSTIELPFLRLRPKYITPSPLPEADRETGGGTPTKKQTPTKNLLTAP